MHDIAAPSRPPDRLHSPALAFCLRIGQAGVDLAHSPLPAPTVPARRLRHGAALVVFAAVAWAFTIAANQSAATAPPAPGIRDFISRTWTILTRSTRDLPKAARD